MCSRQLWTVHRPSRLLLPSSSGLQPCTTSSCSSKLLMPARGRWQVSCGMSCYRYGTGSSASAVFLCNVILPEGEGLTSMVLAQPPATQFFWPGTLQVCSSRLHLPGGRCPSTQGRQACSPVLDMQCLGWMHRSHPSMACSNLIPAHIQPAAWASHAAQAQLALVVCWCLAVCVAAAGSVT